MLIIGKMSDSEDSFSEGEVSHLCQKALYVQPAPRAIDLNTVPADGNEFIHKSRLEDSLLDFHALKHNEDSKSTVGKERKEVDKVWKRKVAADFAHFANQLKSVREFLKKKHPQRVVMPVDDEIECCAFCLGSAKSAKVYGCNPRSSVKGHLPLLSYLVHLEQGKIHKMLGYTTKWYRSCGMDVDINRWIFSFLACINKPLSDELEEFLEDYFDDCKIYLKTCKKEECRRVHLIMSLLENYFCVKSNNHSAYFDHFF
ncbi:gem-associated protein 2 isoform X2 [Parasteatoda tepidariorum]|uniref:gem-associated protein 2 isoform X2 n=1 Tax=Parasteatoda tepidariorum TaxID=114398 RepID=UPI00077FB5C9|nr:gem-associated protein 2 isoform X1 [Parasteatoda tepidariorum]XP_042908728.1 gem-associated protein 2 isoform X1 [Parasteatoda tepidariorum]